MARKHGFWRRVPTGFPVAAVSAGVGGYANTEAPTLVKAIDGTDTVDDTWDDVTLYADNTVVLLDGTWVPEPGGYTYQHLRDSVEIGGATVNYRVLTSADDGAMLSGTVAPSDDEGAAVTTAEVGPVLAVPYKDDFGYADQAAAVTGGWTFQNTAATFSSNEMTLTNSGTGGRGRHLVSWVTGKSYRLTLTVESVPAGGNFFSLRVNNATDTGLLANSGNVGAGNISLDVTPGFTGQSYVDLRHGSNPATTIVSNLRIVELAA